MIPALSKIILGTAQFGLNYGINNSNGKISNDEIFKILDFAYKKGIKTLDTAPSYGDSEILIGNYFELNPNKQFKVITKISNSNLSLERQLMSSLNKLKIEKIQVLLFHSFDLFKKFQDEIPLFVRNFKGKYFNELGVSVYGNDQINMLNDNNTIERIQSPFNLLDNSNLRKESILNFKSKGKRVDARSIFLQGLFFKSIQSLSSNFKSIENELIFLNKIANDHEISLKCIALNYALGQKYLDHLVIGIDSLQQLKSNIKNINTVIPNKVISKINSIRIKNPEILNPSLWPTN